MHPIVLPSNQPPSRFYRGGASIANFRGEPVADERTPEDWVASTTAVASHERLGLTPLPDGRLLRDEVESDPVSWLGQPHVDCYGADTKLLVKLLDAGERLPVHAHPGAAFAYRHLGKHHGKAEAWFMLTPGHVFLGLKRDVSAGEIRALVNEQDAQALLALLHRREVEPGDTVYVPPGTLHAIGQGTFLVEVQEPEDLSILLEWRDFSIDGRSEGHLGLGFDAALGAVDLRGRSEAAVSGLMTRGMRGTSILAAAADEYFTVERHKVDGAIKVDAGFSVVVVIDGALCLAPHVGDAFELRRGSTVVAPHSAGPMTLSGTGECVVLRPPIPHPARR